MTFGGVRPRSLQDASDITQFTHLVDVAIFSCELAVCVCDGWRETEAGPLGRWLRWQWAGLLTRSAKRMSLSSGGFVGEPATGITAPRPVTPTARPSVRYFTYSQR